MEIERPNASPLTLEELNDLNILRKVTEKAIDDGVLTADESQFIKRLLWKDGKISPQEMEVIQALIWDKVQSGTLVYGW